jgi:hypothetical protein
MTKGELRFGESVSNPFAEGEALRWFHLVCAACMRPAQTLATLDAHSGDVPEREWLRATAVTGAAHRRLPRLLRAERAGSGRATCRQCREPIAKGTFRFALQLFEEDMRPAPIGFLHPQCSEAYFGTRDVLERVARLTPELTREEVAEIGKLLAPPGPSLAKVRPPTDSGSSTQSG